MDEMIGTIMIWPLNWAPVGWLFCAGQTLNIAQYQALHALIGTTYGGNGQTTFQLPDLRGRVPAGFNMGSTPPAAPNLTLGQQGGEQQVTLLSTQMPAHTHPLMISSSAANANLPSSNESIAAPNAVSGRVTTPTNGFVNATPNTALMSASIGNTGNNLPHDNMQPYLGLSFIICWQGVYPSRN
jgi:microcystin-dependent protein